MRKHENLFAVLGVEGGEIDVVAVYDTRATAMRCVWENNSRNLGIHWIVECDLVRGDWDSGELDPKRRTDMETCGAVLCKGSDGPDSPVFVISCGLDKGHEGSHSASFDWEDAPPMSEEVKV